MRRLLLYIYLTLLYIPAALAQDGGEGTEAEERKYLIYFTNKEGTPFSLDQPRLFLSQRALERRQRQNISFTVRDLPVNPAYIVELKRLDVSVWYTSRWFNAAVVQCSEQKLEEIGSLPFVQAARTLNRKVLPADAILQKAVNKLETISLAAPAVEVPEEGDYGLAFHQANMLGAPVLHSAGFAGEGMMIAVFDAGFPAVNSLGAFSHLFQNEQLKGTYDFVQKQQDVYGADAHGTAVLSTMAAYAPGEMIGTAYAADYLLLRTEDAATEHTIEEINWLLAAEYADSAGADVINSSLGYTTFDSPSSSYTYQDMDGNTSLVSRAADMAAATGILVVVSAGNEGNKPWKYIAAPADADSVLTVGAVDSLGTKAAFSSFGPTADGQIKPDVVALGRGTYVLSTGGSVVQSNGTSFSGPVMAGFATSLWQAHQGKTNMQMVELLRQIGSNTSSPDNNIGYGIPNYSRVVTSLPKPPLNSTAYITNPVKDQPIILSLLRDWWQQSVEVQVLDATGKFIYRQLLPKARQEQVLNLQPQHLKEGIYICRIRSGSRVIALRFVKL